MGLKTSVAMAKAALEEYNVQGWLHLDHGNSYELVRNCLDAGFDSVMIDGSELSFDENVESYLYPYSSNTPTRARGNARLPER